MNCKLPIRSEIYHCIFKKTNKVSILLYHYFLFLRKKNPMQAELLHNL